MVLNHVVKLRLFIAIINIDQVQQFDSSISVITSSMSGNKSLKIFIQEQEKFFCTYNINKASIIIHLVLHNFHYNNTTEARVIF